MVQKFLIWYTKLKTIDRIWTASGVLLLLGFTAVVLGEFIKTSEFYPLLEAIGGFLLGAAMVVYFLGFGSLFVGLITGRDRKK